ncbi:hypothetical protein BU24DRAFT_271934 [Aaosphaeria arxii CBS 175.79]|uniref:Uncharacterized protein n=1 Tax=Aaosphaeria arxii CBS 175.79 TaxID=1450172 RepID=A0A6A5XIQ8_9PLEO|nr:uncharacterized protein BU24DRAFT_271934 [Aaosphaeria arxii CBS 175.79]KAF2012194.1 hypothetical protein BU24DRAFT_271934 [Aaosphaeria arxii CBS 175.79]
MVAILCPLELQSTPPLHPTRLSDSASRSFFSLTASTTLPIRSPGLRLLHCAAVFPLIMSALAFKVASPPARDHSQGTAKALDFTCTWTAKRVYCLRARQPQLPSTIPHHPASVFTAHRIPVHLLL